jgi:hypothetical protein
MGKNRMLKILSIGAALSFLLLSSAVAQPRFPCAADIKKACADVDPGGGGIVACIKEHFEDYSDVCKKRLTAIAEAAKVCREDVKKQCGSVRGRVRKASCVMDALTDLSDACQDSIAAAVAPKK